FSAEQQKRKSCLIYFCCLFLLMLCLLRGSHQTCPPMCLCISDTVSCSASGLARPPRSLPFFSVTLDLSYNHLSWLGSDGFSMMPRLENLWMARNQIRTLRHGAFGNISGLRLLDLSSNQLHVVEQHYFQGLWRLEELRLFNNKITQLEANHSHPFLAMLDLSSNRMTRPPWEDVKALPRLVQRGLYLHNNSLVCDCSINKKGNRMFLSKLSAVYPEQKEQSAVPILLFCLASR
uniref:Adhesion molecule with Ig-like domain 3 n=1 Tax=Nothobranchius furzeri TaxID=105023 RepID=A0A8C6PGZ0_NOTFU